MLMIQIMNWNAKSIFFKKCLTIVSSSRLTRLTWTSARSVFLVQLRSTFIKWNQLDMKEGHTQTHTHTHTHTHTYIYIWNVSINDTYYMNNCGLIHVDTSVKLHSPVRERLCRTSGNSWACLCREAVKLGSWCVPLITIGHRNMIYQHICKTSSSKAIWMNVAWIASNNIGSQIQCKLYSQM